MGYYGPHNSSLSDNNGPGAPLLVAAVVIGLAVSTRSIAVVFMGVPAVLLFAVTADLRTPGQKRAAAEAARKRAIAAVAQDEAESPSVAVATSVPPPAATCRCGAPVVARNPPRFSLQTGLPLDGCINFPRCAGR